MEKVLIKKEECDLAFLILKKCVEFHVRKPEDIEDVIADFARVELHNLEANQKKISSLSLFHIRSGINLFESLAHLPNVTFFYEQDDFLVKAPSIDLIYSTFLAERGSIKANNLYVSKELCNYLSQLQPSKFMNTWISNTKAVHLFNQFTAYFLQKEQLFSLPNKTTDDWKFIVGDWYSKISGGKSLSISKLASFVTFLPKTREELETDDLENK